MKYCQSSNWGCDGVSDLFVCLFAVGMLLRKCVGGVCEVWLKEEETLNQLDRGSGDGDCGTTLKAGALGQSVLGPVSSVSSELADGVDGGVLVKVFRRQWLVLTGTVPHVRWQL